MFRCCWGHIVIRLTGVARRGPALIVICVMIDDGREEMALWFVCVKPMKSISVLGILVWFQTC